MSTFCTVRAKAHHRHKLSQHEETMSATQQLPYIADIDKTRSGETIPFFISYSFDLNTPNSHCPSQWPPIPSPPFPRQRPLMLDLDNLLQRHIRHLRLRQQRHPSRCRRGFSAVDDVLSRRSVWPEGKRGSCGCRRTCFSLCWVVEEETSCVCLLMC